MVKPSLPAVLFVLTLAALVPPLAPRADDREDWYQREHTLAVAGPTRFGLGARGLPLPTFEINAGQVVRLTGERWSTGLDVLYHGAYDFLTDLPSSPVVGKVQNPSVGLFWESLNPTEGERNFLHFGAGWAHESNGQFLEKASDFDTLATISPTYRRQLFASMGWNYYYGRAAWTASSWHFGAALTLKHFFRQDSVLNPWTPDAAQLEDTTNITGDPIPRGGIRAFAGTELEVGLRDLAWAPRITFPFWGPTPVIDFNFDTRVDVIYKLSLGEPGWIEVGRLTHDLTLYLDFLGRQGTYLEIAGHRFSRDMTTPTVGLYAAYHQGYKATLAEYFQPTTSFSAGLTFGGPSY